ncbi:MAG: hypothetical protein AAF911_13105 [Planctomycetota bacterium]
MAEESGTVLIPTGAEADDTDFVFRAISVKPEQWTGDRPSSAAFLNNPLSVAIQSKLHEDRTQAGQACVVLVEAGHIGGHPKSGVVGFACLEAKKLGFATHHERDESEHESHAHVYSMDDGRKIKKSKARAIAKLAAQHVVRKPG